MLLVAFAAAARIQAQMPNSGAGNADYAFGDNVYNLPEARIAYAGDTIKANAFVVYRYDEASDEYSKLILKIQLWPEGSGCACVKRSFRPVSIYGRQNSFIRHLSLNNKGRLHTFEGAADVFATAAVSGGTPEYATAGLKYKITFDPYDRNACKVDYTIEKAAWEKANTVFDTSRSGWSYNNPKGGIIKRFKYSLSTYNAGNNRNAFDNDFGVEFVGLGEYVSKGEPVRYDSILLWGSTRFQDIGNLFAGGSCAMSVKAGEDVIIQTKTPAYLREENARIRQGYTEAPQPLPDKDPYVEMRVRCKPVIIGDEIVSEVSCITNLLHY